METTNNDSVTTRLRSPPTRTTGSVTSLIQQYLPEIQEARRNGKTWCMIGRDLRPEDPIKADTARRTVKRAEDRQSKAQKTRRRKVKKPTPQAGGQAQLALQPLPPPPNPFGRKVDPIRLD